MLQEFCQWIENVTAWKIGVDLFIAELPLKRDDGTEVPERCIVIYEDGPAVGDGQLPDRSDKEIQIWNQASDYWIARADAFALYKRIHGKENITLPVLTSGEDYLIMEADGVAEPAPIAKPNAKGLYEFSTNFILRIEEPYA